MPRNNGTVGFGPSLVDIGAKLPDEGYQECCDVLGVEPGGWRRIEDPTDANKILQIISGLAMHDVSPLDGLMVDSNTSIVAGSSTFGMLGAMPPELRSQSSFVSAVAAQEGVTDRMSAFFSAAVDAAGIDHQYQTIEGHNPMGFVLSGMSNTEKTLAMYPGIAPELEDYDLDILKPELVIIDTYELLNGKMADYLNGVIDSGAHRIALSLGNHTILNGAVKDKIRDYVESGKITVLCGNTAEYLQLFPECEPELATKEGFRDHPVLDLAPYALMTLGAQGAIASWQQKVVEAAAHPLNPQHIVNTSGAGDVTAGVFCGGVLAGDDGRETLQKAAYYATQVLRTQSSMVLATT